MLLVNARVGVSKIYGFGLIANEFIPKGKVIWEYRHGFDVVVSGEDMHQLPEAAKQVIRYAEFFPKRNLAILASNDGRFTNHSDYPNAGPADNRGEVTGAKKYIALWDIHEGDEITCDYRKVMILGYTR